ncbi:MAG: glutamate-5-semialdehyde dehydrogenase [Firmicutes bacterium]|nr:glutamate-5-semialdehyde dehydrogenase [Bacillota bacterium]
MKEYIRSLGEKAKAAAAKGAALSTNEKNAALAAMAKALRRHEEEILNENAKDMAKGEEKGLSRALLDRLQLNHDRIEGMAEGLEALIALADPIGSTVDQWKRPNGLEIAKKRVPLGVVAIIYEARPNVTADAAGLCLKTGNAVILKGGSEAYYSNLAVVKVLREALSEQGLAEDLLQFVESTDREAVSVLLKMRDYVDVVIPRGGAGLIRFVVENATIPSIETGTGNCHVYIDKDADLDMGVNIIFNAKTQRPAVCNAAETLLVHKDIAADFLPKAAAKLSEKNVEIRGCEGTCAILPDAVAATEEDWETEFLDYILAVKVVDSMEDAMNHIARYSSGHSEAIITENYSASRVFTETVDAAAVYVNASTRFTDGNEFGFGAEIGISTQKLHARGPMGLAALTTEKYIIMGMGQTR